MLFCISIYALSKKLGDKQRSIQNFFLAWPNFWKWFRWRGRGGRLILIKGRLNFFQEGADFIFLRDLGRQKYFHQGQNRGWKAWNNFLSPLKFILPLGHNRQEGVGCREYLIITKESLVLASAPFANEIFFHQGRNILFRI